MKRARHSTGGASAGHSSSKSSGAHRKSLGAHLSSHHKENTQTASGINSGGVTARMKAAAGNVAIENIPAAKLAGPVDTAACLECLRELRSCKDDSGRQMARLFMQLPSKKLYPDYYQAIKDPISLIMIRERVERKEYSTMAAFKADLDLMFSNAQTYNVEGSEVHSNATHMKKLAYKFLASGRRSSQHRSSSAASAPSIKMVVKPPAKPQTKLSKDQINELCAAIEANDVKKVQSLIQLPYFSPDQMMDSDMFGQQFQWGPLHCAAYHGRTRILSALAAAGANVELNDTWYGGTPLAWAAFGDQVKAAKLLVQEMHADRDAANSQGQIPFDLVSTPSNPAWLGVLTDEVIPPPKSAVEQLDLAESIKLPVPELIRKMLDILVDTQDITGRRYSEIFMDLPSRKAYPDYFTVIKQPMSFNMIEKQLKSGSCDTFQKFEMDVMKIFENAMFFNQEGSVIYEDAKHLKEAFVDMADAYRNKRKEIGGGEVPKIKLKFNVSAVDSAAKATGDEPPPVRQKRKYVRRSLPQPRNNGNNGGGMLNGAPPPMMQFYTPQYMQHQQQQRDVFDQLMRKQQQPSQQYPGGLPFTVMDITSEPPASILPILSLVDICLSNGDRIFQFHPTVSMRSVCLAVPGETTTVVVASELQSPPPATTTPALSAASSSSSSSATPSPTALLTRQTSGYAAVFINTATVNSRRLYPLAPTAPAPVADALDAPPAQPQPVQSVSGAQKVVKYEVRLEPGMNCLEMGCYGQWRQCEDDGDDRDGTGDADKRQNSAEPRVHAIQQQFRVVICRM